MARKRAGLAKLDYQSLEYWNKLLAKGGLTMRQGLHPKLSYVGGGRDVEYIEGARRTDTGKIKAKPQGD
jgi:hypothetical protein